MRYLIFGLMVVLLGGRPTWFRVKSSGHGFIPCSWQGWTVVALLPVSLLTTRWILAPRIGDLLALTTALLEAAALLAVISLTGGRTGWNWIFNFGDIQRRTT